ncbi:hypothetical protein QFC20_003574 [Naganishia adeliensis]|uniref:Uncharacterized protein n=1 Tax=Naganishia adeliensis TaxID=92952 RepID=A0ACC2WAS0_9TREE|nr:hypothetical protein QFC20_003574 [Naganishia adeliensis]
MMRSAGTAGHEDLPHEDRRRSKPSGRVPSPLTSRPRSLRLSNPDDEEDGERPYTRGLGDDGFDIEWPSTPTHEPGYDSLPEYVSPATEAFDRAQEESRRGVTEHRAIPRDEPPHAPVASQDQVLFRRVVATMTSCLGKAKALAQKQHQYQGERLLTSAESIVLRVIGSWLMKQIPPLERANELFSFAESECMFEFLEELVRMDGLLAHPVLHRERWESDVYEHLQTETESLQKCFLGVAATAVVNYLQHKSSRLTEDMPRVLYICKGMLKERPRDPSQVLLVLPKIRAQLRDSRSNSDSRYGSQIDEAEGLLDILYELTIELGGSFPTNFSSDTKQDEPSQPEPRTPSTRDMSEIAITPGSLGAMPSWNASNAQDGTRAFEPRSLSVKGVPDFVATPPGPVDTYQHPPHLDNAAPVSEQRGFAADFFNAPTPGPSGVSTPVLEDLERKQDAASQGGQRPPVEPLATRETTSVESRAHNATYEQAPAPPTATQPEESLLMAERPRAVMPLESDNEVSSDQEGKGSSSSSDEGGYASGMDASSILPLLLRKKLEGKRKGLAKPPLSSKLGLGTAREQSRPLLTDKEVQESPPPTEVVSRESSAGSITKARSPGSYFPPSEYLAVVPKSQEEPREALRMRPAPVAHKPSVYTPITASPLRASTSLMSPEELTAGVGVEQQRPGVISTPVEQERPNVMTPSGMTTPTDCSSGPERRWTILYTHGKPEYRGPWSSTQLPRQSWKRLISATVSDNESIKSNEVMTSDDVKAGLLDGLSDEEMDEGVPALTEAEKDLAALEPEALIPGPREIIIASRNVRDMTQYDHFPDTYRGAVPRIEVTPGAIQNTKGEVIPIYDEDIHLAAGETLIDGTGRVWNAKGMIEPGRDDQGLPILYEVDIAQIKRANNGELPLMMPWDDERLLPDGSRTPSTRSEDIESATPMSELSSVSDAWEPPLRPKRRISEDLNAVDSQLMASAGVDDIPEEGEEDDVPPDDVAMREEEEAEEAREEEFQQMVRRRKEEERRMGSTP